MSRRRVKFRKVLDFHAKRRCDKFESFNYKKRLSRVVINANIYHSIIISMHINLQRIILSSYYISEVNVNIASIATHTHTKKKIREPQLRSNATRVTQSNANPDCFVNRVSTQKVTDGFVEHTANWCTFWFRCKKKERREYKGNKTRKPSYTGKKDYVILALRIVSPKKAKRSASRVQARVAKFTSTGTSRFRSVLICNEQARKAAAAIREKASLKCRRGRAQGESVPKGPKRSFRIGRDICRLRLLEETINSVG